MDALASAPWIAVVLLTLAVALAVVEAAVAGLGLAGAGAVACVVGAGAVVWQTEAPWWPLVAVAAATALWTALVGWPRAPAWAQVTAAGLHAAGGVGYGVAADDRATVVVAVLGASALAAGFPGLHRWTRGLVEQPPRIGMEALVGRTTVVEAVAGDRLAVRLDGSLWSIAASAPVTPGQPVVVRGWHGMVLEVGPEGSAPGVPSARP